MTTPVLQLEGLTKRFAGNLALDDVDLALAPGEIRGLVGENGAGKSTLIKILAGIYTADEGTIRIDGREVNPHHRLPIAFVHQDLGLVDELSVGENIALTAGFPRRSRLIRWKGVWEQAVAAYERMGLTPPDARTLVGSLLPAEKALLGIVRALSTDAAVAVLDEPTASLPAPDVSYLLDALRELRSGGTPILYVTHRLQELYEVADTVTVLRSGKRVAEGAMSDFTVDQLVEQMLGRALAPAATATATSGARAIARVADIEVNGNPVSLEVREGEVLGLVGLRGAGQEAIGRALVGAHARTGGSVVVDESEVPAGASIGDLMARGIALLPADRQRESTFSGMSLIENLFPGRRNRSGARGWISPRAERERSVATIERYDVRPPRPELPIDQLSGGNQQKVVVGRVLAAATKLAVLEEPTAGVDVGSKFQIHDYIRETAASGVGVIVVSSDFEEVVQVCTRVLVVVDGRIAGEAAGADLTQERLIVLASSHPVQAGAA